MGILIDTDIQTVIKTGRQSIYVHIYTQRDVYMYVYVCKHAGAHACTHVCVFLHIQTSLHDTCIRPHALTDMRTCMHMHIHVYAYVRVLACMN